MKRLRTADIVPGRTYVYHGFRDKVVIAKGLHKVQTSPGRHAKLVLVTLPDGREASVSISSLEEAS